MTGPARAGICLCWLVNIDAQTQMFTPIKRVFAPFSRILPRVFPSCSHNMVTSRLARQVTCTCVLPPLPARPSRLPQRRPCDGPSLSSLLFSFFFFLCAAQRATLTPPCPSSRPPLPSAHFAISSCLHSASVRVLIAVCGVPRCTLVTLGYCGQDYVEGLRAGGGDGEREDNWTPTVGILSLASFLCMESQNKNTQITHTSVHAREFVQ